LVDCCWGVSVTGGVPAGVTGLLVCVRRTPVRYAIHPWVATVTQGAGTCAAFALVASRARLAVALASKTHKTR
jgi:hypothetical protein